MITYKTCTDVPFSQIYDAFQLGFSDYFVPLSASETEFEEHFFGPEGNMLEYSFIAFCDTHPIGLLLGGIRIFDTIKTMRCGALCLAPDLRGKGISEELFLLHKAAAVNAGCKQLFLEVIKENHRAVRFYAKTGYLEAVILKYYKTPVDLIAAPEKIPPYKVTAVGISVIKSFREKLMACHINWQSDIPYYEDSKSDICLGAYDDYQLIGLIAMNAKGKINFLWVEPSYRLKGLGHYLLYQAAGQSEVKNITVCIPGNALLEGFFRKLGFEKDKIEQYEMYLPI
jgi:GNAT superfamily N-acetyltransferase